MNYNLLDQEWIPVLYKQGTPRRVGIIEALTQAGHIRQIASSNPMDRVAILRFLLALLYWCNDNPRDGPIPADSFPREWFTRLDDNRECFELLGEVKRFYQYKSSSQNDKKPPVNYLVHEVPTGTNVWHFRHATDKVDGLCPACCALGLVRLPVFTTQGGAGKSPGINGRPPVYVIPLGSSLAHTLSLSWQNVSNLGTPAWENPALQLPKTGDVPLLTGLTWLPRCVWLDDPEEPEGKCISCARKELLIRQSVYAGRGSIKAKAASRIWHDPHVIRDPRDILVTSRNPLDAADAMAGDWARVAAGVLRKAVPTGTRQVWIVGFATDRNKYLEAKEYEIPLLSATDEQKLQDSISKIQTWQKEGSRLAGKVQNLLRRTEGTRQGASRQREHVEVQPMLAALRPHVEDKVSTNVGELLAGGDHAWQQAAREYSPGMDAIARSLSPGYTTAAVEMRRRIASVEPNMRLNAKAAKKPGSRKGEKK